MGQWYNYRTAESLAVTASGETLEKAAVNLYASLEDEVASRVGFDEGFSPELLLLPMTQQVAGCQVFRWMSATVDSGFVHASTLSCVLRGDTLRLQHVTLEDKTSAVYIDLLTEPDRGGRPIAGDRLRNLQAGLAGRINRAV